MPYQIEQEGDKFCVYNLDNKKKVGEFDDRAQAMKKMKALYAADKKNPEKETPAEDKAEGEEDD